MKKIVSDLGEDFEKNVKEEHEKNRNELSLFCCLCVKNKKKNPSQPNDISVVKFYNFEVDINHEIKTAAYHFYKDHFVCISCLEKFDKKKLGLDERTNLNNFIYDIFITCFCNICKLEHKTTLKANKVKNKNNCCANGGCSIF